MYGRGEEKLQHRRWPYFFFAGGGGGGRGRGLVVAESMLPQKCLNKTPKVVSVGCVGLWKHSGVLSDFGKIRKPERCVVL